MTTISTHFATSFRFGRILAAAIALFAWTLLSLAPLHAAAEIPGDDDQDVLIRTTLMTFNDANMTGDYSVLYGKASKEFQSQLSVEKLQAAFEPFRKNELFFEDVVTAEYASFEKAALDNEGALVLAGVFKTDDMEVKYRLRYVQNNHIWKLLGLNVDATRKKQ